MAGGVFGAIGNVLGGIGDARQLILRGSAYPIQKQLEEQALLDKKRELAIKFASTVSNPDMQRTILANGFGTTPDQVDLSIINNPKTLSNLTVQQHQNTVAQPELMQKDIRAERGWSKAISNWPTYQQPQPMQSLTLPNTPSPVEMNPKTSTTYPMPGVDVMNAANQVAQKSAPTQYPQKPVPQSNLGMQKELINLNRPEQIKKIGGEKYTYNPIDNKWEYSGIATASPSQTTELVRNAIASERGIGISQVSDADVYQRQRDEANKTAGERARAFAQNRPVAAIDQSGNPTFASAADIVNPQNTGKFTPPQYDPETKYKMSRATTAGGLTATQMDVAAKDLEREMPELIRLRRIVAKKGLLPKTKFKDIESIRQWASVATSDPDTAVLQKKTSLLADSLQKTMGGSRGGEWAYKVAASILDPTLAPDAFEAVFKAHVDFLKYNASQWKDFEGNQGAPDLSNMSDEELQRIVNGG